MFTSIGNGTDRKDFLREVTPPVHAGCPRKYSRLEVIGLRITKIRIFAFDYMVLVKQGTTQFGAQDRPLEIPVESTTQSRMSLLVSVDKCRRFLRIRRFAETRRIAERIAQNFTHEAGMSRRSKAGIIFGAHDQVLLLSLDNVDRVHLVVGSRSVLMDAVFIGAVQGTKRPGISAAVGAVKLRIDVVCREIKWIRRFHIAVLDAISITLAELGKELFAQVLEHFLVKPAERETEAIPEKPRRINHHFLKRNARRAAESPIALGLFRNILYRSREPLADGAFAVIVMDFDGAQDMRIHHRQVARETDIQVTHVRNAEPTQMVRHVARTGTVIIKGAAEILLTRDTRHLAQVFRHVEAHTGSIFQLIQVHLAFKVPLHFVATTANHGTRPQVADIGGRLHRDHHVKEVCKILQFHLHAVEAVLLKNEDCILGIHRQFEATVGIRLTQFFPGDISDGRILNRQIGFGFQNDTHNQGRGRSKQERRQKQD